MNQEYPKNFARFYDIIYQYHRDGVDNEFFLNEIKNTNGRCLDIGVGTGRLFIDALKNGSDIYGIDISTFMLDVLLGKLNKKEQNRVSLQNIIDFRFKQKFDLIIAPFRVFMHLHEKEDQLKALKNVFRHLNKNGKFIFDTFIPDLKQLINGLDNFNDYDGEYQTGKKLRRFVSTKPDAINQIINITFLIEWEEDNTIKQEKWETSLRFFFRYELEHLIERSDFFKYRILGDYHGNPLDNKSKEFIVICKK